MQLSTRLKQILVVAVTVMCCTCTAFAYVNVPDNPPANPPFYGAYYITGVFNGQEVTIYTNTNTGWGVNDDGFLYRLGGSATGIIYIGNTPAYSTSLSAYNLPRYRNSYSSDYIDVELAVTGSNILINDSFEPVYGTEILWFCVATVLLGLILIVSMRKRG